MKGFELKSKQQIEDFLRGCTFLGTGGGGAPDLGIAALTESLQAGKALKVEPFDDIKDDETFCSVYLMGSIAPPSPEIAKKKEKCGVLNAKTYSYSETLSMALDVLEEYTGKKVDAIFAIELGGSNTGCPMAVAANRGLRFYDADADGRAVPEMPQALPSVLNKPLLPIGIVNDYGDTNILIRCSTPAMIERNGKMLADSGFGSAAHACYLMSGKEVRDALVPGTLSESLRIGTAIREARESGADPVKAALEAANGYHLFDGVVRSKEGETIDGLYYGATMIDGTGDFAGTEYKIWFENENHILWKNGEKWVTSPDLIQLVRKSDGEPLTNTVLKAGDVVSAVAMRAREQFRSGAGLDILSPRHFGFDYDWVPVEEVLDQ